MKCPDYIEVIKVDNLKNGYVIFDTRSQIVLDNAQGYGYKSPTKAIAAFAHKTNQFEKIRDLTVSTKKESIKTQEKKQKVKESDVDFSFQKNQTRLLNSIEVIDPKGNGSFIIIDKNTGEILDDNDGVYFSTKEDALRKFTEKSDGLTVWPYDLDKKEVTSIKKKKKPQKIKLNIKQQKAYQLIKDKKNVFISGSAGTGKSALLNYILQNDTDSNTRVCAPTGIAALNIEGVTIHKLLGLNPKTDLIHGHPKTMPDELADVDRVIIDEISMCRADLFNWLSQCLRMAEKLNDKPIQLIVVGDFCQLPPVISTKYEKEYFKDKSKYAFATKAWKSWNFQTIVLSEVMRQQDLQFINALNKLRVGNADGLDYIRKNSARDELNNAITLTSRNRDADEINLFRLDKLDSEEHIFKSKISGNVSQQEKPVPDRIVVKKNAQIISMVNDPNGKYQNGSIGKVIRFVKSEGKQCIIAEFDKGTALIAPNTWSVYDYLPDPKKPSIYKKTLVGEYTQIPVKLGYAITIHKAQGQTYDRVNIYPAGWLSGLLYVSLSRVKQVNQLYLESNITKRMVNTDPTVINFYKNETLKNL